MEALRVISDEHQSLASILHAVRFLIKEIAEGRSGADMALLQSMVRYLDLYAERHHHPKEDLLFKRLRLRLRTPEGDHVLDVLAEQHAKAPERIAVLRDALDRFAADRAQFGQFARAFDHYAEFYRGHMMLEEDQALPMARAALTPNDWAEMDLAFAEASAPDGGEDFQALFSHLVACAPTPIGLGARLRPDQKY